jgi:F0F1-type ATP synthase assembly protein I
MVVAFKLFFAFIWTFILGWLCKKGFKTLSWFLVLLPYIIMALAMLKIFRMSNEQKQMLKSTQLQGAYGLENFASNNKGTCSGSGCPKR